MKSTPKYEHKAGQVDEDGNSRYGKIKTVYVRTEIIQVINIDAKNAIAKVEFRLWQYWFDEHVASKSDSYEDRYDDYVHGNGGKGKFDFASGKVWMVDTVVRNEVEQTVIEEGTYLINSKIGMCQKNDRYISTLKFPHNLRKFPFDAGKIEIFLESATLDEHSLRYKFMRPEYGIEPDYGGGSTKLGLGWYFNDDFQSHPEWKTQSLNVEETVHQYGTAFSRLITIISVKRKTSFYWFKVIMPLSFVPVYASSMFLFKPLNIKDKIDIVTNMLLTVFAFLWVIAGDLPKAGYLVALDWLIIVSLVMLFLMFLCVLFDYFVVRYNLISEENVVTYDRFVCIFLLGAYFITLCRLFIFNGTICESNKKKVKAG